MISTQRALRYSLIASLFGLVSLSACSNGRNDGDSGIVILPDGEVIHPDFSTGGGDGGTQGDGGGDGGEVQGGPCTPGGYRCGVSNAVEICNSSGTAWLYSATCSVSCSGGLCTGACPPTTRRCNMNHVEECSADGTAWKSVDTCATYCESGQCALPGLDITASKNLDGLVLVSGDIVVRSGVTLTSPAGDLTLKAKNITVENGASIAANPTGQTPEGGGANQSGSYRNGGGGGGYAQSGAYDSSGYSPGGGVFGSTTDMEVQPGGKGGDGEPNYGGFGGKGGGALRLYADGNITIDGQVTANGVSGGMARNSSYGGGGGGSGGGILLAAAADIKVSGSVSATLGGAGPGYNSGGKGGDGRVKILAGGVRTVTGTISGTRTDGLLPPVLITSNSHPDANLTYNDDFPNIMMSWTRPFASRQGYYQLISKARSQPPTPATGSFVNMMESSLFMPASVTAGDNYFHITPVDSMSNVGTIESVFHIRINTTPPSVTSMSHPSPTAWVDNANPFFMWTFPVDEKNVKGVFYVFDNFGDTVPNTRSTFIPVAQKQLLRSGVPAGVWVLHVVAKDPRDYLTKQAAHYRVNIGKDPGSGVVLGQVVDGMGQKVAGATIDINRGLYSQGTNMTGNFNFASIPVGTWEVRATKDTKVATQMVTLSLGDSKTVNLALP